ncbi:hypothetical protein BD414DRAFT_475639 [Trametes punicea]|nr:hypothetical protein BD414DRAFT_475639 [Trametes punicea]
MCSSPPGNMFSDGCDHTEVGENLCIPPEIILERALEIRCNLHALIHLSKQVLSSRRHPSSDATHSTSISRI